MFLVFKNTTVRDHYLSYRQQTSRSVRLFGVQSLNWVAEGMSNSFAGTVQANDGGTRIHGGGSVRS
jgi:hypothetical protein